MKNLIYPTKLSKILCLILFAITFGSCRKDHTPPKTEEPESTKAEKLFLYAVPEKNTDFLIATDSSYKENFVAHFYGNRNTAGKIVYITSVSLSRIDNRDTVFTYTLDSMLNVKVVYYTLRTTKQPTVQRCSYNQDNIYLTSYTKSWSNNLIKADTTLFLLKGLKASSVKQIDKNLATLDKSGLTSANNENQNSLLNDLQRILNNVKAINNANVEIHPSKIVSDILKETYGKPGLSYTLGKLNGELNTYANIREDVLARPDQYLFNFRVLKAKNGGCLFTEEWSVRTNRFDAGQADVTTVFTDPSDVSACGCGSYRILNFLYGPGNFCDGFNEQGYRGFYSSLRRGTEVIYSRTVCGFNPQPYVTHTICE